MKIMRTVPWLSFALALSLAGPLTGQTSAGAPVRATEQAKSSQHGRDGQAGLRLRIETWEVPALEILRRMDTATVTAGADPSAWLVKLRQDCLQGAIPSARLIQSPVVATDETGKILIESEADEIYPVDYEPPGLGSGNETPTPESQWAQITAFVAPSIIETRTTGVSLASEATRAKVERNAWDVSVELVDSALAKMNSVGSPAALIVKPEFTSTHTNATLRLREGQWQLLSVKEAPRPAGASEPSENRLITVIRIDRES